VNEFISQQQPTYQNTTQDNNTMLTGHQRRPSLSFANRCPK